MPRVVHFELGAEDPARAIEFYRDAFGWDMEKWSGPPDYWLVTTGSQEQIGINGGLSQPVFPEQKVVVRVAVPNAQRAIELAQDNGGRVLLGVHPVEGMGYLAYFEDPDGNIMGVVQFDPDAGSMRTT